MSKQPQKPSKFKTCKDCRRETTLARCPSCKKLLHKESIKQVRDAIQMFFPGAEMVSSGNEEVVGFGTQTVIL